MAINKYSMYDITELTFSKYVSKEVSNETVYR